MCEPRLDRAAGHDHQPRPWKSPDRHLHRPDPAALASLPAFCRVAAITTPAVNFEVWLPLQDWNGKFQGVGNGAKAGSIGYAAMATA